MKPKEIQCDTRKLEFLFDNLVFIEGHDVLEKRDDVANFISKLEYRYKTRKATKIEKTFYSYYNSLTDEEMYFFLRDIRIDILCRTNVLKFQIQMIYINIIASILFCLLLIKKINIVL